MTRNEGRTLLLDGGLATELERRGASLEGGLWSARALLEHPELVLEVHRAFLEAGADVVTTASYQASVPGLLAHGLSEAAARDLLGRSVALARRAAAEAAPGRAERPLVAASIGPYGAYLADGSEYRGDYRLTAAEARSFHRPRLQALLDEGPDVVLAETMPHRGEIAALLELLLEVGAPRAWISLSCPDGARLADGSSLDEVAREIASSGAVEALGVNCVRPSLVEGLLARLRDATDLPLVAYPNRGDRFDPATRAWRPDPSERFLGPWVESGAAILGGCCRTTPCDISALRQAVDLAERP